VSSHSTHKITEVEASKEFSQAASFGKTDSKQAPSRKMTANHNQLASFANPLVSESPLRKISTLNKEPSLQVPRELTQILEIKPINNRQRSPDPAPTFSSQK